MSDACNNRGAYVLVYIELFGGAGLEESSDDAHALLPG